MARAVAALAAVNSFDGRGSTFLFRRAAFGRTAAGIGALTGAGAMGCAVMLTTAWMLSTFCGNSNLNVAAPTAIGAVAPTKPFPKLARVADMAALAWDSTRSVSALELTLQRKLVLVESSMSTFKGDKLIAWKSSSERADAVPALEAPTAHAAQAQQPTRPSAPSASPAKPTISHVVAAAVAPAASAFNVFEKKLMSAPSEAHTFVTAALAPAVRVFAKHGKDVDAADKSGGDNDAHLTTASLPPQPTPTKPNWLNADNHTAIYDIEAHTVYLPNGEKLEAHSGIGYRLDDPRYVREKARGPTPPNVYELALREQPFHGVRAIRLNPVDDGGMYGRDGILAHTYMLGPSGQSFGCVSFKDYQKFLQAFLRGEINRLVVVPHLENRPSVAARASREQSGIFAFSDR